MSPVNKGFIDSMIRTSALLVIAFASIGVLFFLYQEKINSRLNTPVAVAARDIKAGENFSSTNVAMKEFEYKSYPAKTIFDEKLIFERRSNIDIKKGQPIYFNNVLASDLVKRTNYDNQRIKRTKSNLGPEEVVVVLANHDIKAGELIGTCSIVLGVTNKSELTKDSIQLFRDVVGKKAIENISSHYMISKSQIQK